MGWYEKIILNKFYHATVRCCFNVAQYDDDDDDEDDDDDDGDDDDDDDDDVIIILHTPLELLGKERKSECKLTTLFRGFRRKLTVILTLPCIKHLQLSKHWSQTFYQGWSCASFLTVLS